MYQFVELPLFTKRWKELELTDLELRGLQNFIMQQPNAAVDLGSGLQDPERNCGPGKARWDQGYLCRPPPAWGDFSPCLLHQKRSRQHHPNPATANEPGIQRPKRRAPKEKQEIICHHANQSKNVRPRSSSPLMS